MQVVTFGNSGCGCGEQMPGGNDCPTFVPESLVKVLHDHRTEVAHYDDLVGLAVYVIPLPGAVTIKAATATMRVLAAGCKQEAARHEFAQAAEGFKLKALLMGIIAGILPLTPGAIFSPYFAAGAAIAAAFVPVFVALAKGKAPSQGDLLALGGALTAYGAISGIPLPTKTNGAGKGLAHVANSDEFKKKKRAEQSRIDKAVRAGADAGNEARKAERAMENRAANEEAWGTAQAAAEKLSDAWLASFTREVQIDMVNGRPIPRADKAPTVESVRSTMDFVGRVFGTKGNAAAKKDAASLVARWTLEGKKLGRAVPPLDYRVAVKVLRSEFHSAAPDVARIVEGRVAHYSGLAPVLDKTLADEGGHIESARAGEGEAPRDEDLPMAAKVVGGGIVVVGIGVFVKRLFKKGGA